MVYRVRAVRFHNVRVKFVLLREAQNRGHCEGLKEDLQKQRQCLHRKYDESKSVSALEGGPRTLRRVSLRNDAAARKWNHVAEAYGEGRFLKRDDK